MSISSSSISISKSSISDNNMKIYKINELEIYDDIIIAIQLAEDFCFAENERYCMNKISFLKFIYNTRII